MKKFIYALLSGDVTSSKRFAALLTLVNVIIIAYISTIKNNGIVPTFVWNGLIIIVGGGLGLTVVEKIFGKTKNAEVVEDPAEQSTTGSTEN